MRRITKAKGLGGLIAPGTVLGIMLSSLPGQSAEKDVSGKSSAAATTSPTERGSRPSKATGQTKGGQRLREGSKLADLEGRFEVAGERVTFFPADNSESFRVLENLSLERIHNVLAGSRENPQWIVSGVVTEFNGANYLLLIKAVQSVKPAN